MSTSPSASPRLLSPSPSTSSPRTPVDHKQRSSSGTPPSDDSSIIDDLSFDYVFDNDGNYVRLSKGSASKSDHSSPPTPQDNLPTQQSPNSLPKPSQPQIARRTSLSRSESAYPVLESSTTAPQPDVEPPRSFQRVASGPALSNSKPKPLPRRVTAEEWNRRQTTRSSHILQQEKENLHAGEPDQVQDVRQLHAVPARATYGRPTLPLESHSRQAVSSSGRAGRIMKSFSAGVITEISAESENDPNDELIDSQLPSSAPFPSSDTPSDSNDTEEIEPALAPIPSGIPPTTSRQRTSAAPHNVAREPTFPQDMVLRLSTGTRPRRSASLSDALNLHGSGYLYEHHRQQNQDSQQFKEESQHVRSGPTSTTDAVGGPRRVTLEEREREVRKYRMDLEAVENLNAERDQRSEPPPDHPQQAPLGHRQYGHKRRDSDTLRSMPLSGSPTVVDSSLSASPGVKVGRVSPPGARIVRISPPGKTSRHDSKGRVSPSSTKMDRASPPAPYVSERVSPSLAIHRRSPEAASKDVPSSERVQNARSRAASNQDEENYPNERQREQEVRRQQKQQLLYEQQLQGVRAASAPPSVAGPPRQLVVNKKVYARLDMIGKGGSSRVFRVLSSTSQLYAIKRVALDKTDAEAMSGYMNEIALLKRLEGNARIIRLIDSEVKPGPGGSKGTLMLVMECGEVDLARLISDRINEPLNMVWVSYYWQQMLQAVHVIHEEKIVHSDLKPANFVIVRGQLKLIDFGIANAIANDTTNIQRDHQIGTVNYMSPEAIELPEGMRRLKVGRPSDIWSLGCILYQMIYGQPPFQHLSVYQKMKAIPDVSHIIDFPEYSVPVASAPKINGNSSSNTSTPPKKLEHLKKKVRRDVIDSMKGCLDRNPKKRATIPDLLEQDWLAMKEQTPVATVKNTLAPDETVINPYYMRQLLQYGIKLGGSQNADMSPEALLREAERLVVELKSLQSLP